jgi:hypothetical protein
LHTDHYAGVRSLGATALEIQFIEVSRPFRRRGIGTQVISYLTANHPDRRPVASSDQADEYWSSLEWHRYDHKEGSICWRPLFAQT